MKVTPFEIYIATRCDAFGHFLWALIVLLFLLGVIVLVIGIDSDIGLNKVFKWTALFWGGCLVSIICLIMCPTTKEAAAMLAIPPLSNNESVPKEVVELCQKVIKEENAKHETVQERRN